MEEAFDIPWLGKFFRCESGHTEMREPEGHRALDHDTLTRLRAAKDYVGEFARRKYRGQHAAK